MKGLKNICFALVIISLLSLNIYSADSTEFLYLADISPGMEGQAKTVFQGTDVESFPVEVIDIIKGDLDSDLILIEAYGEKIDKAGGIASGMSGSPVYIDDQLIGAIGYGWDDSPEYALVTPIEYMLDLFSYNQNFAKNSDQIIPLKTPLVVSGLDGRALDMLETGLSNFELDVIPEAAGRETPEDEFVFEAGSAIAVQMVRGDVNAAALGTLTYRDGDDFLALGHPFTERGEVSYSVSGARINKIIPGNNSISFKLGSPLEELKGVVNVDRGAGIAGSLNRYPQVIPLQVEVTDLDRDVSQKINTQLTNDQYLLTSLGNSIVLQVIDSTIDRLGEGTAYSNIKIKSSAFPDWEIESQNIYYNQNDVAVSPLNEITELFNLIAFNPFERARIFDIKVEVDVTQDNKSAILQRAEVVNDDIEPGDDLKILIDILPYRGEIITEEVKFQLPENIEPGTANLVIEGGFSAFGSFHSEEVDPDEQFEELGEYEVFREGYKDLEEMIDEFLKRPRNNEVAVRFIPDMGPPFQNEEVETENDFFTDEILETIDTDYVVEGTLDLELNISGEEEIPEREGIEEVPEGEEE